MPTTRKQKKTRKSRGVEMSPDIENLDMMLGGSHLERRRVKMITRVEDRTVLI